MVKLQMDPSQQQQQQLKAQKRKSCSDNGEIDKFPDEILVHILSRMSLKEAARTSVLAHRWKYLWRSVFGTLQFDSRDVVSVTAAGVVDVMEVEKFVSWVNNVLQLHQGRYVEGMVVIFKNGMIARDADEEKVRMIRRSNHAIDTWVCFAVQKEVGRFELLLPLDHWYEFPSIKMLRSHSSSPFHRVRSIRLERVLIEDEVVCYLLASCPNLEKLSIWCSGLTKNIQVVDPPSLKFLEIKRCWFIESVEISAESLVSLAYVGHIKGNVKKVPNLRELTIGGDSFLHFISEPISYSDQLVKLVVDLQTPVSRTPLLGVPNRLPQFISLKRLELQVGSVVGRSLLFFTWMIKASPQLCEFRIEMSYIRFDLLKFVEKFVMLPAISGEEAVKFDHRNLKVVEMYGYVGCSSEKELLLELFRNAASSIERVSIDTASGYYDELASCIAKMGGIPLADDGPIELGATTRAESKERAKHVVSTFPRHIKFVIT